MIRSSNQQKGFSVQVLFECQISSQKEWGVGDVRLGVDVMMNKEKRGDANTWQTGMGGNAHIRWRKGGRRGEMLVFQQDLDSSQGVRQSRKGWERFNVVGIHKIAERRSSDVKMSKLC